MPHKSAMILSDVTPESAFQRKNATFFLVYLFWAFLGVTLAEAQMVLTSGLAS